MKLLVLDSNSILNRAFYAIKLLTTKEGEFTNGIYGFLNILFSLLEQVQPDGVVCAFDLPAPTFRHKLYDGYKGQRKGMPQELASQLEPMKELLRALGYTVVQQEGYEADDILGTLAQACREQGNECTIATGDRDSLQLVREDIQVLLASSKGGKSLNTLYDPQSVEEKYGVTPEQLIDVKALMGDASDNIPGVAGVGEKTATALIAQFGSLDAVYQNIEDPSIKKGVREKLLVGKESAYLSQTLGRIDCHVPMDTTLSHYLTAPRQEEKLAELLTRLEMFQILKKLSLQPVAVIPRQPQQEEEEIPQEPLEQKACQDLSSLVLQEESPIYLDWDLSPKGELTYARLLQGNQVYLLEGSAIEPENLVTKLIPHCHQLVLHGAKSLYHMAFRCQQKADLVAFDTEIAAYILNPSRKGYPLEELVAEYGCTITDVSEDCLPLLQLKQMHLRLDSLLTEQGTQKLFREIELPLTQVLASMERYGFLLDAPALEDYGKTIAHSLEEIAQRIYGYAEEIFNINSPKQLGEILFGKLGLPTQRKNKSGYSTDVDTLQELVNKHPIVKEVLEYRKLAKLQSTYVEGLLRLEGEDHRLHTSFQQTETRTGRISSTEPNLQNIPVRTEMGAHLRKFFCAEEGMVLVDADYSQIELRVLAHMAEDSSLCEAFRTGEDIHLNTAAQVFQMPKEMVTPHMRSSAKAVNFGIVYGIGAFSLAKDIGVTVSQADTYIKNYLATFHGVKQFMERTIQNAHEKGYVETMFGRRRYLPELKASNRFTKAFGERAAMNMPIQGTAADIIKLAMVKVYQRLEQEALGARLILQVHDELIIETPIEHTEAVSRLITEEMESAVELLVPLLADTSAGATWFDAK